MALIVNGEIVAEAVILEEMDRMRPRYEEVFAGMDPEEREAQLRQWAWENAVERVLVNQEARRRGERIPPQETEAAYLALMEQFGGEEEYYPRHGLTRAQEGEVKADLEHHLRVERLLDRACAHREAPTDADLAAFYDEHREDFRAPERVGVAHIVKHIDARTDPAAARRALERAKAELDAGTDFAAVAAKYSDCPDRGGDLGLLPRGQMVEEFEDVVFALPPGGVTGIFPTRFGFHVARVYARHPAALAPLEQVREQVAAALEAERRREAVEAYLDKLRAKAVIEETEEVAEEPAAPVAEAKGPAYPTGAPDA